MRAQVQFLNSTLTQKHPKNILHGYILKHGTPQNELKPPKTTLNELEPLETTHFYYEIT